jgi:hypothetical protein
MDYKKWQTLGWRHNIWELVRYYHSLRTKADVWLKGLANQDNELAKLLQISKDDIDHLKNYVQARKSFLVDGLALLRTEDEAIAYCSKVGFEWGTTKTKSKDHHQASKTLIATVAGIAKPICDDYGLGFNPSPQTRCIWKIGRNLHVSARNLDGAIPGVAEPFVVWEIKEYWGKTGGGSKMSDAVYECHLVGREIREFEEKAKTKIFHLVFVDGSVQWHARKSDLLRLIDLASQGLIDDLFIGEDVETRFGPTLNTILNSRRSV